MLTTRTAVTRGSATRGVALPDLGSSECPRVITEGFSFLAGDYVWSEKTAPLWLNLLSSMRAIPAAQNAARTFDIAAMEEFARRWAETSRRFDPKSRILPGLLYWHQAPLRFDWQAVGLRLDEFIEGRMSWNDAWDYTGEILRDPSSHTMSALQGDKYVPTGAERATWSALELDLNVRQPKGKPNIKLTRPWSGKKPTYTEVQTSKKITPAAEARRAKLDALY